MFTVELYAVKATVEYLLENDEGPCNYTIFCDSQSVLHALKSNDSRSLIVGAIKNLMSLAAAKTIHINLCWVPGHCGIAGNDKANTKAKFASNIVDELRQMRSDG